MHHTPLDGAFFKYSMCDVGCLLGIHRKDEGRNLAAGFPFRQSDDRFKNPHNPKTMNVRISPVAFASMTVLSLAAHLHAESAIGTGSTDRNWSDTSSWSGPPAVVVTVTTHITSGPAAKLFTRIKVTQP